MNQQLEIGACMGEGVGAKHRTSSDQFPDTSGEEVATSYIVADLADSLELGKLEICPGEEGKNTDEFKDATVTGFSEGAGVDDVSYQTNKEAHCTGTSDKPVEGFKVQLYEYLLRTAKKHDGNYIPQYEKQYGNFHDASKHPRYRFLE
ncbi:hypothetical protein MKW92_013339 [Papaver armeniacum]|nr:hypothetical protein MKW92_013339 [Papaver armeniacum]